MHVYFTESGRSPNPSDKDTYSKRRTFSSFKRNLKLVFVLIMAKSEQKNSLAKYVKISLKWHIIG